MKHLGNVEETQRETSVRITNRCWGSVDRPPDQERGEIEASA